MSTRPSTRSPDRDSARWWIVGVVAVVVIGALGIAVIVSRRGPDDLTTAPVVVTGAPLPDPPVDDRGVILPGDPGIGQVAPALAGQRFDGQPLTIPGAGRPKVVTFLAHWCPHCRREVPVITEHLAGGLPPDVDLFAVSTAVNRSPENFPPGAWLRRENWPVPTLVDDAAGTAAGAYGLSGFPFFVAVDAGGRVVDRQSGELSPEQFDQLLTKARG